MAIRIKRSASTAAPASLLEGQLAYSEQAGNLFIGISGSSLEKIGGSTDVIKLGTIAPNANNYVHPTADGDLHVPATGLGNDGKVLTAGASAGISTWETIPAGVTDHTLLSNIGSNTHAELDAHVGNVTTNPHAVTASQVGADPSGTDNSTNVTLTGTGTYLSIAGQIITQDAITESDISDLRAYLLDITGEDISDLADVTITSAAAKEVLQWTGAIWANKVLAAIDVSYDNGVSGLSATNVKAAIDEVSASAGAGVEEYAAIADHVASNTIEQDVNVMDWTGHAYAVGTSLQIELNHIVTFANGEGSTYRWTGPKPALIGLGGTYTTTSGDFLATGSSDHSTFINRGLPDQHPIGAVTGLQAGLDGKVDDGQVLTDVPAGALFTDTVYTHPSGDGNLHVPANGTGNDGDVLTASASAGNYTWEPIPVPTTTFAALTDTPADFVGSNDYHVFVNAGANALEFRQHIDDGTF